MNTQENNNDRLIDARQGLRAIAGSLYAVARAFKEGRTVESARLDPEVAREYAALFRGLEKMINDTVRNIDDDILTGR